MGFENTPVKGIGSVKHGDGNASGFLGKTIYVFREPSAAVHSLHRRNLQWMCECWSKKKTLPGSCSGFSWQQFVEFAGKIKREPCKGKHFRSWAELPNVMFISLEALPRDAHRVACFIGARPNLFDGMVASLKPGHSDASQLANNSDFVRAYSRHFAEILEVAARAPNLSMPKKQGGAAEDERIRRCCFPRGPDGTLGAPSWE